MGFSQQECWSGLPFPSPGDLPDPRIEPEFLASPALADGFFTTEPPGKPRIGLTAGRLGYMGSDGVSGEHQGHRRMPLPPLLLLLLLSHFSRVRLCATP